MSTTREYNNTSVSSYNEYGSQQRYNTLFANKLPDTVPSMNFPVVLQQNTSKPYGYDALTHDSDGTGYYTVKTGYSRDCEPVYNTVKCPENRVLRPFLPSHQIITPSASPIQNELISEGYSLDLVNKIKNLELSLYHDVANCPHSKKLFNELTNAIGIDNVKRFVQLKDINNKSNEQQMTNLGGYAVPFVYSNSTNNSVTGYYPLNQLLNELSKRNEHSKLKKKIIELDIVLYVLENCVYCQKVKEMLGDLLHLVQVIDAMNPNVREQIKNFPGFPVLVSKKTGKHKVGLPNSIHELVKHLSN